MLLYRCARVNCTHGESPQVPFISNNLPYVTELAEKLSSKGFCYLDRICTSFDPNVCFKQMHISHVFIVGEPLPLL